tara:strand:+ start:619 stop:1017 length:399 start_codon:yes stop_codon:yes gene_type:complete
MIIKRKNSKKMIFLRDSKVGTKCPICGIIMGPSKENVDFSATIEHKVRLADGGKNCLSNIVICCKSCNNARDIVAKELQRQGFLGYSLWAEHSINPRRSEPSLRLIAENEHLSFIDSMFWQILSKKGIGRPD